MQIVILISIFIVFIAVCITLFFCYQEELKIWFIRKFIFPDVVNSDNNKKFDIFLNFSNKDKDFVLHDLLPILEGGPDPFDICTHEWNRVAGELFTKQIAESVNDSRRMLVVLSNDFLDSVWGKMEFRAAHTKAIEKGRASVIFIKYGELDVQKLDEEMNMYLKTITTIEWGRPWFWRKLRYALPHSHIINTNKNQNHTKIMLKIDEKFDLTCPPLVHPESTLSSNTLETSLAETTLVIPIDKSSGLELL